MPREIVVDTNVIGRQQFGYWLRRYYGRKYLPAIAYAEAAIFSIQKGKGVDEFHGFVTNNLGLIVERMDHRHSWKAADLAFQEQGGWGESQARDYMIAGHVADTGRVLVTENLKHFTCLGESVMSMEQAMDNL